ncbi:hypothetical protein UFOVP1648_6 [uncultured Caudovirales phage]|uniref:Uncharacterized protein n=1 Tax=uncultured Caudovirales phage TaxID=2100421 RepID=A0A6J5T2N1_9CAUD|nr:hypothetical protein UFOVP1648_6 [uncultured Caudovirales phage]
MSTTEEDNLAFLIKTGQIKDTPEAAKPTTTKKEEE